MEVHSVYYCVHEFARCWWGQRNRQTDRQIDRRTKLLQLHCFSEKQKGLIWRHRHTSAGKTIDVIIYLSLKRSRRKRQTEGQTGVKGVSSNSLAETSERRGGAYMGFPECVAVILNWTELNWQTVQNATRTLLAAPSWSWFRLFANLQLAVVSVWARHLMSPDWASAYFSLVRPDSDMRRWIPSMIFIHWIRWDEIFTWQWYEYNRPSQVYSL